MKEAWRGRGEAFLCILLCHFRFHATPLRLAFKNWKISPESCKKRKIVCKVSEKKKEEGEVQALLDQAAEKEHRQSSECESLRRRLKKAEDSTDEAPNY